MATIFGIFLAILVLIIWPIYGEMRARRDTLQREKEEHDKYETEHIAHVIKSNNECANSSDPQMRKYANQPIPQRTEYVPTPWFTLKRK